MPHVVSKTVFKFEELSDSAKEKARSWWRDAIMDAEWWDTCYEDASDIGKMLGIDLNTKRVQLLGGGHRYDPCIYFSGFSSQGDGACYEASYEYAKGALKKLEAEFKSDDMAWIKQVFQIASALQQVQRQNFYQLTATTKHRGHYYHSYCMDVEVSRKDDKPVSRDDEETVKTLLRDYADWIYRHLERECEYQNSDEVVDENIIANEYDFDEDGKRA